MLAIRETPARKVQPAIKAQLVIRAQPAGLATRENPAVPS
jgi:hypothetical protein